MHLLLAVVLTIHVDAAADRHPIDPRIYGLNFATAAQLADLNVPLNRSGGNATTRYNWQQHATNHASDWYFESLEEEPIETFVADAKGAGAEPMITIPIIGWVARLGPNRKRLSSFSIAKYGAQQDSDWRWFPDAGNGVRANGSEITGNDPNDADMPVTPAFMTPWVAQLAASGVRYYLLDNEHGLWQWTHRDVHPVGAHSDELLARMIESSDMIRDADSQAIVIGPEEWGWTGYLLSAYDQQWADEHQNWWSTPDRLAHDGMDYLPWLLTKFREHEEETGRRVVDVFTVHFYPQGGEFSSDVSRTMQLRRNRSTRALWDPNYTDESWIDDQVQLIPRLKSWVAGYGLEIGITEYNWGAEEHMNGATAQADILGIFGREGLDLAARWTTPATGTPVYDAIRLYRNYDGAKSSFGDVSVRATVPNPDEVAAFAAVRSSDRALTIMLINKQLDSSAAITLDIANFTASSTERWELTSAGIHRAADVSGTSLTLPAQSVTLLVVHAPGAKKRRAVR